MMQPAGPSPIPDPIGDVLRTLFGLPSWLQIAGALIVFAAGCALLVLLWRKRAAIRDWLVGLSRPALVAVTVAAVLFLAGAAWFGRASWNYTQHANAFCVSCHVMDAAVERFIRSEHYGLQCHDCHQQSIFASLRQVYLWVVERPEDVGPHAKVPNERCASCHIDQSPEEWPQIAATAGHRVHFESDRPELAGLMCVECHGATVHEFIPVDRTCAKGGCHDGIEIRLGRMTGVATELHCTMCHGFLKEPREGVPVDTARAVLSPRASECLVCHQMRTFITELELLEDPHQAACGTCHNPHVQRFGAVAFTTCTTSGCHERPDTVSAFHESLAPDLLMECATCHRPHSWRIDGSNCTACHRADAEGRARRPLRRPHPPISSAGMLPELFEQVWAARVAEQLTGPAAQDTFLHSNHRNIPCTRCHDMAQRHGSLRIRTRDDCMACHHSAENRSLCTNCHGATGPAETKVVTTPVRMPGWSSDRTRELSFEHARHRSVQCTECHTAARTNAVERECRSCHESHHRVESDRQCTACHAPAGEPVHNRTVHLSCAGSGCHAAGTTATLAPARPVCLACHTGRTDHYPGRECASCHAVHWDPAKGGAW